MLRHSRSVGVAQCRTSKQFVLVLAFSTGDERRARGWVACSSGDEGCRCHKLCSTVNSLGSGTNESWCSSHPVSLHLLLAVFIFLSTTSPLSPNSPPRKHATNHPHPFTNSHNTIPRLTSHIPFHKLASVEHVRRVMFPSTPSLNDLPWRFKSFDIASLRLGT